jgi:AhpD family alkylhydroperoxidase
MPKTLRLLAASLGLAVACATAPALAGEALDAAKADMLATLGPDAVENYVLPDAFFESTWAQARALWSEGKYTIPAKYRVLIGLAVGSQIPCAYCIYADTSDAHLFGATDEEIKEAIMFAALTREWSTILNGNQVDLAKFKAEIDAAAAAAREGMKTAK